MQRDKFFLFDTPFEPFYDTVVEVVRASLNTPFAVMTLIDDERQFFKAASGLTEPWASTRETPLSHSICQHVVAMNRALVIDDALTHPLVKRNPAVHELHIGAYLGHPIRTADAVPVGALATMDQGLRSWTRRDQRIMQNLAELVDLYMAQQAARRGIAPA